MAPAARPQRQQRKQQQQQAGGGGDQQQQTVLVQPKTRRGKRALEKRAPKMVEDAKRALFLYGGATSALIKDVLTDLHKLKGVRERDREREDERERETRGDERREARRGDERGPEWRTPSMLTTTSP